MYPLNEVSTGPFEEPFRIPITDTFDLHAGSPGEMKDVLIEYLSEANRLGFRVIRIIHGRGIGVQREMVRAVLSQTPWVQSFSDAPAEAGGWGATVVTLREPSVRPLPDC